MGRDCPRISVPVYLRRDLDNFIAVIIVVILEVRFGRGSNDLLGYFLLLDSGLFCRLNLTLLHLELSQGDIQEVSRHLHIEKIISGQGQRDPTGDDGQQVLDDDTVEGEREGRGVAAGNAGEHLGQELALEGQH